MKYSFYILFSFLLLSSVAHSQHEADFWYFGNYAGLDFSSGNPEPLTDGQLKNYEGCATISDSLGNLLFYTNGVTVWNKNHQIMANGTGLKGNESATQSAIIIPQPKNDSLFYIFTADVLVDDISKEFITDGLNYSIVNMNKDEGKGKIITKNILLLDSVTEKITAIKHQNKKDIWLISHEWGNNKFYAWLINENGLNSSPVISNTGATFVNDQRYAIGYLKASPSGNEIISNSLFLSKIEIFDFNNISGNLSEKLTIDLGFPNLPYGCEFSPNGSKIYFTKNLKIFQADMNAGTNADIINSITEIAEFENVPGALQNAKNGKLYIASDSSNFLSVINYPDSLPATCSFEPNAIFLDGKKSRLGLPNFIQSYFKKPYFRYENVCLFDETHFVIEDISNIDSVIWNFGDPESGNLNTSKLLSPTHFFSNYGIFKVTLTVWFNNIENEYSENIKIVPLPKINLGNDTVLCIAENHRLNAYSPHMNYLWNDATTDSILWVNQSGKYWVNIENTYTNCKNSDTINIVFSEIPEIYLGKDTFLCKNSSYTLDAFHSGYSYTWQDNSHSNFYTVTDSGVYFVEVSNQHNCKNSDTIKFTQKLIPYFYFPEDTIICETETLSLHPDLEIDTELLWQDGSSERSYTIFEEGIYKLTATNICGLWLQSINVEKKYCGDIYIPNVFTPTNDGINEIFFIKGIEDDAWDLIIYSRWGEEVFHSKDYKNDWKGDNLTPSVYYYILSNRNLKQVYKGTVRIIR